MKKMRDLRVEDMKGIEAEPHWTDEHYVYAVLLQTQKIFHQEAEAKAKAKALKTGEEKSEIAGDAADRPVQPSSQDSLNVKIKLGNKQNLGKSGETSSEPADGRKKKRKLEHPILDDDDSYPVRPRRPKFEKGETSKSSSATVAAPRYNFNKRNNLERVYTDNRGFMPPTDINAIPEEEPRPQLPEKFKKAIYEKIGKEINLWMAELVIEKRVEQTDVSKRHNRLSMPENNMIEVGKFLKPEEENYLIQRKPGDKYNYITVKIIQPSLEVVEATLRRWVLKKGARGEDKSVMYVINGTWNEIVQDNVGLKKLPTVQLWAFRDGEDKLCFALVEL